MKQLSIVLTMVLTLSALSLLRAEEPVDIDVKKAAELIEASEPVIVLDVRSPEEFAEGHIEGAVNVDYSGDEFDEAVAKLDPTKPYIVYCAAGFRSERSLATFKELKFLKIYHLRAGYNGWVEAGKPVVK